MTLSSPVFKDNDLLPKDYTCQGNGLFPTLSISDVPANTQELVLIVDDPDAPRGLFTHLLVADISPNSKTLPNKWVLGINSSGQKDYVPPCPPSGIHRYRFHLYAVNKKLNLSAGFSREELESKIKNFIIDESVLVGLYRG